VKGGCILGEEKKLDQNGLSCATPKKTVQAVGATETWEFLRLETQRSSSGGSLAGDREIWIVERLGHRGEIPRERLC